MDGADEFFGPELVYVTPEGDRRTLAAGDDVGAQPGIGSWNGATISPDGEWVAGEWTAECEVQIVFLINVADGRIIGTDATPLPENLGEGETIVLGWHDGQVLIATPADTGCSSAENPGVYAVDPAAGTADIVTPLSETAVNEYVLPWRRQV